VLAAVEREGDRLLQVEVRKVLLEVAEDLADFRNHILVLDR
jgi:hypothetical protein